MLERRRLGISSALDLEVNAMAEPAVEQRGAQCCRVDPVALAVEIPIPTKHRGFEHEPV